MGFECVGVDELGAKERERRRISFEAGLSEGKEGLTYACTSSGSGCMSSGISA